MISVPEIKVISSQRNLPILFVTQDGFKKSFRVVLDFDGLLLVAEKDQVKKIKLILCHS